MESEAEPGFHGWLAGKLHEGESLDTVMLWVQIFVGFILAVLTLRNFPWFLLITIPVVLLFGWVKVVNMLRKRNGQEPITWYFLATIGRITKWGFLKGPYAKRRVFSAKGKRFVDADLSTIEDPASLDALDLEGTQITDNAIEFLQRLRDLKFLVIRGTGISEDAYRGLQQRLRTTWIWF